MFKVGEILIVREDSDALAEYKGQEVEVIDVSAIQSPFEGRMPFLCRFKDGKKVWGGVHHLRRKKPPTEYKGEQEILSLFKIKPREVADVS